MKVEKSIKTENVFNPIVLKITIESKAEYEALEEMTCLDVTIPDIIGGGHREEVYNILVAIRRSL